MIHRLFDPLIEQAAELGAGLDWKTSLQEVAAAAGLGLPEYRVTDVGPDHAKEFSAEAVIGGDVLGEGAGPIEEGRRAAGRGGRLRAVCAEFPDVLPDWARDAAGTMPELPEVEVVRRGLQEWVSGRTVSHVEVRHPRAIRRHDAGATDFAALIERTDDRRAPAGAASTCGCRWPPPGAPSLPTAAIVGHLGMSGQLLVQPGRRPDETHLRVRFDFDDGGRELRFVDQRTFGGLAVADLVDDGAGGHVPEPVRHIARDPLDPRSTMTPSSSAVRAKAIGDQAGPAGPDASPPASGTSTPTRRSGAAACTASDRRTGSRRGR